MDISKDYAGLALAREQVGCYSRVLIVSYLIAVHTTGMRALLLTLEKCAILLGRRTLFFISLGITCGTLEVHAENLPATVSEAQITEQSFPKSKSPFNFEFSEPEATLFDLYLSDQRKGLVLATYTDEWFQIEDPQDVIEQFSNVVNTASALQLFSGKILKRRELPGIGSITFNTQTFRIIIHLDPSLLQNQSLELGQKLIAPTTGASLRQDLRATYSGEVSDDFEAALAHRTLLGAGKFWLDYDATLIESQPYEVNTGAAHYLLGDFEATVGLLKSNGQRFAGSVDFLGVGLRTATETFLNEESLRGSRLEIFIPSRSRIEFFRDSRLLAVQILDFGLQEIDTGSFPQGSYQVDIVITEDNGRVTNDQRFFTKSGQLGLRDRPTITLQAGALREKFTVNSTPAYEGQIGWRALDYLQLRGMVTGTDEITIGTTEFSALFYQYYLTFGYSLSNEGKRGLYSDFFGQLAGFNFGGFYSATLNATEFDPTAPILGELPPGVPSTFRIRRNNEQKLNSIAFKRSTLTAFVSRSVGKFDLRLSANRNESGVGISRFAYGPSLAWRVYDSQKSSWRIELSQFNTEEGPSTVGLVSYQYRFQPWTYGGNVLAKAQSKKNQQRLTNVLNYDSAGRERIGTKAKIVSDVTNLQDDVSTTNSLEVNTYNPFATVGAFVQDQRLIKSPTTNVGLNAEASVLLGADGSVSVNRRIEEDAGFIAEVQSLSSTDPVNLIIDGKNWAKILPGQKIFFGFSPYRTYEAILKPMDRGELVAFDPEPYKFTLFPGSIASKVWSIDRVFVALGRIVDQHGAPIVRARIKGSKEYTVTEEDGTFQAELTGFEKLTIQNKRYQCSITLHPLEKVQFFHDYGTTPCLPLGLPLEQSSDLPLKQ